MTDETNDPLVPDVIERPTRTVRDIAIAVAAVAVAVAAVVAVLVLVEARGAVAEIRGAAAEGHAAAAEQRAFLRKQSETLDGKGAATIDGALATVDELRGIAHDLRARLLPQVGAALGDLRTAAASAPGVVDEVHGAVTDVRGTVQASTDLVREGQTILVDDNAQLAAALTSIASSSEHIAVLTGPEQYAAVIAGLQSATANADKTLANVTVVSANAADVSTYYRDKVIPKPYSPTGNRFVRGMKRTGHYSLQLLRATPELAVVAVQVAK